MAKSKTTETGKSVPAFIDQLDNEEQKQDSLKLIRIMKEESGFEPRLWGDHGIIGFGSYHYKYESGHEGDAPLAGFSPRKKEFSLYLAYDFKDKEALLEKFGKHKIGKACIYVKALKDVDEAVLRKMVKNSIAAIKKMYPEKK